MDQQTAESLVSLLSQALETAAESRLRLAAFERVMDGHNPGVSNAWRKEIENLRREEAHRVDRATLEALGAKLCQR